jgi:hypothetical protein
MSEKRLYSVEVLFRYYAHAESASEAESWAEAARNFKRSYFSGAPKAAAKKRPTPKVATVKEGDE